MVTELGELELELDCPELPDPEPLVVPELDCPVLLDPVPLDPVLLDPVPLEPELVPVPELDAVLGCVVAAAVDFVFPSAGSLPVTSSAKISAQTASTT